jgi:hypothetical protein
VENAAPNKNSPDYVNAEMALASNKDMNSEKYQDTWVYVKATDAREEKIAAIYDAADLYNMPPTVLAGALLQEETLYDQGVVSDFGNWACGIGQINVNDWCDWANNASSDVKDRIAWPQASIEAFLKTHPSTNPCDTNFIKPDYAKPFQQIFLKRMHKEHPDFPEYMLDASYTQKPERIEYKDVEIELREITAQHLKERGDDPLEAVKNEREAEALRFEIARNFVENCSDHHNGVPALAYTIKKVFDSLPKDLREAQQFTADHPRKPGCERVPVTTAYPLQVGWLLADAVYNAGDEILPGVYHYQKSHHISAEAFGPQELVNAIDYALSLKHTGISAIGKKEAVGHIRGVVNNARSANREIKHLPFRKFGADTISHEVLFLMAISSFVVWGMSSRASLYEH